MLPDGEPCERERVDHIHETVCTNGQTNNYHHSFNPPQRVTVLLAGRLRYLKVPA
jgi:hypothetical protein